MRNLVIGAKGFLGKDLCEYLHNKGEEVVPFDVKDGPAYDAREVELPLGPVDRVYFLAWDVGGANYLYKEDTQENQLMWNLDLLRSVMPQLVDIPFLFVSSQLSEDCNSVYGILKRLGEIWSKLSKNGRIIRLWNIYGGYELPTERSHVVSDFIHQAIKTRQIRMQTTGEELRQFIHIDDVCSALYKIFEKKPDKKVYDVSSFKWIPVKKVAETIAYLTDSEIIPGEKKGRTFVVANKEPVPGWEPLVSLEEGMKKTVASYKNREDNK